MGWCLQDLSQGEDGLWEQWFISHNIRILFRALHSTSFRHHFHSGRRTVWWKCEPDPNNSMSGRYFAEVWSLTAHISVTTSFTILHFINFGSESINPKHKKIQKAFSIALHYTLMNLDPNIFVSVVLEAPPPLRWKTDTDRLEGEFPERLWWEDDICVLAAFSLPVLRVCAAHLLFKFLWNFKLESVKICQFLSY